ncbi:MAG: amidohydrolase [Saprospiraceae bacterium]|nr:amidohydrolase [Saprospiraceae bacterium]
MRCFFVLLLFCVGQKILAQSPADPARALRIFYNGKIFTAERKRPLVQAIAIRGDTIVALGRKRRLLRRLGKPAELVDLHGKCLLPGLIDSHIHAVDGGQTLLTADLADRLLSLPELAAFVAESRANGKACYGDVLMVTGLNLAYWTDPGALAQQFDTGAFAGLPLLLVGMDYHTGWLNQAMLGKAGIDAGFIRGLPAGEQQWYGHAADFEPNGLIREAAFARVSPLVPPMSDEKKLEAGRAAIRYCNGFGLTAWLDPVTNDFLPVYHQLAGAGELTAHVAAFLAVKADSTPVAALEYVRSMQQQFAGIPDLTISGIKIFADGVVEYPGQTAALSRPYRNSGQLGDLLFAPEHFAALAVAADRAGLMVHVHAIGDRAVTETLNGFEQVRSTNGNSGLPHSITHLQFVQPADFPRFRQLGVIASFQLLWAVADTGYTKLVEPYLDPELYGYQYPANSMRRAGAVIAGASDWSVSSPNPFEAMVVAETRRGENDIVLNKKERLPRKAMLYAYTIEAARAMHQDDRIGSLAVGKQADLVLVDRDVLRVSAAELRQTQVLWTMLGGRLVYSAQGKVPR